MLRPLIIMTALCMPLLVSAQTSHPTHAHGSSVAPDKASAMPMPYAGFEQRDIKSLSDQDLVELREGSGWGLALAAELNGKPGPSHLLALREPLELTPEQVTAIEQIYAEMKAQAQLAGERYIEAEAAIEAGFRQDQLSPETLSELIMTAAQARADLRFVHLSRHLETPPLLTPEQIERYNTLRGYATQDPCDAVPEGHNAEMWRRHNQCD